MQSGFPWLSVLTFLPMAGALLVLLLPRGQRRSAAWLALGVSTVDFVVFLAMLARFDRASGAMQLVERVPWIPQLGVTYHVGVDGLSILLVGLTTFLTPIGVLVSWKSIENRVRGFMASLLLLETGILGAFISVDLFLFYLFWEAMLVPMYFLIGIWGSGNRIYAAVKFFLYTAFGSLLMLVGILVLSLAHQRQMGVLSFDLDDLSQVMLAPSVEYWVMLAFFIAFAIKVPMFPFHTWLPDAHTEAPTAGSVILAGVLLKMGGYGFLRFALPLFPHASSGILPVVMACAIIGIIYGALVSMVQPDLKRLVAFSSVSHLGFVVLGIYAMNQQGMEGAILQMVAHGLSTGALFCVVGMLYERRHTRLISDFGGLATSVPVLAGFLMLFTLASLGLPGLSNFVGEYLVLVGAFQVAPVWAILAALGVILAAVYLLWMYKRVMFGPLVHEANRTLRDLDPREMVALAALAVFIVWIGVAPGWFLGTIHPTVENLATTLSAAAPAHDPPAGGLLASLGRFVLPGGDACR
jgi:NADH-quinone oxidoreductase subunit M